MTWALIELSINEMRYPFVGFSAYVEQPFDALNGIGPTQGLPIQGVAIDSARASDYDVTPVIAFPPREGAPVASTTEEEKYCSLRVDLAQFADGSTIRIGLYGYVAIYNISGGLGMDGPLPGTIFSSELYGSVTKDFRGITGFAAADLSGAPEKLFIANGYTGFGYERLITSFPELTGKSYEYLGSGQGDKYWIFNNDFLGPTTGHSLGGGANHPISADANDYLIYPVDLAWTGAVDTSFVGTTVLMDASIQAVTIWGAGIAKTLKMNCVVPFAETPENMIKVASLPPPPYTVGKAVTVRGFYQTQYWLPIWRYANDRSVPINVAFSSANLWDEYAQHDYNGSARRSLTWETENYPDRPEMAEFGTAVIPAMETPDLDLFYPASHFGHARIGTIILYPDSAVFEPVEATPVDGGDTGDGPDGDGTAPGRTANPQLRTWTYSLDGHDYYVLRLGDTLTLVYDDYSEQWMDWTDFSSLTWRAHCGVNWTGAQNLADTYGSSIVCGDDAYGLLWFLDPNQSYDDAPNSGDPILHFSRVTIGQVPMKGRENLPCYATWLTTDMGDPSYLGAAVTLYTSDDAGVSWDKHDTLTVTPGDAKPELSWYSLGQIEAPGRLFKIFDDGAIARIDALEMNDPDDDKK